MSIFEYDEEKHLKSEREFAYNAGMIEGEKIGVEKGLEKGIRICILDNLNEGISQDSILQKLQTLFFLSKEDAEAYYSEVISNR